MPFAKRTNAGATAVLTNDVITQNTATTYGGGIFADDYNTLYVINSTVSHNVAPNAAGIYADWSDVYLVNSAISANNLGGATGYGAGIYAYESAVVVKGGSISGNVAGG